MDNRLDYQDYEPSYENRNKDNVKWNVISENEFKEKVTLVFNKVAESLTKTLGPYGSTTIIERYGEMAVTKDGWNVLKGIRSDDPVYNNILMLLCRIAAQVVIKVGDGSTSSVVAANAILNELENKDEFVKSLRPKDFMDVLSNCVNHIVEYIYVNSTKIDKNTYDDIRNIAYIATNGDDMVSDIIHTIYKETGNPAIDYVKSKTEETTYEIVNGYKANMTYLDNIFTTHDDNTCIIENPYVMMFNFKIDLDTYMKCIIPAITKASEEHRRVVVIAPHYDKYLLDSIKRNIQSEFRNTGSSTVVYCNAPLVNNISHEMYNDFAVLCGATVISEQDIEDGIDIDYSIGWVESMVIGPRTTLISGFVNRNENMYKKILEDANMKYMNMLEENQNRGIVDIKLNDVKNRATKLQCNMGVIHVGGNTTLEKNANYDLVEDAVKACESAYNYGYNIGGNLIISIAIDNILSQYDMDDTHRNMYCIIKNAFKHVLFTIFDNKCIIDDINNNVNEKIYKECVANRVCYDIVKEEYSANIINSCETDIEILKATASIISLLISSNQYISIESTTEMK